MGVTWIPQKVRCISSWLWFIKGNQRVINQNIFVRTHVLHFVRTLSIHVSPMHSFINEAPDLSVCVSLLFPLELPRQELFYVIVWYSISLPRKCMVQFRSSVCFVFFSLKWIVPEKLKAQSLLVTSFCMIFPRMPCCSTGPLLSCCVTASCNR